MILHWHVAKAGKRGVSSGKLGYDLEANRRAVTAALYKCLEDGLVENMSEDGVPKWRSLVEPYPDAGQWEMPAKFAYQAPNGGGGDSDAPETGSNKRLAQMIVPVSNKRPAQKIGGQPVAMKQNMSSGNVSAPAGGKVPAPAGIDDFEIWKMILHWNVAQSGDGGVSSGKLGYDLGANRKAVTAALYKCIED